MSDNPKIRLVFNPKKGTVLFGIQNAKEDRDVIHKAFRRAIEKTPFKSEDISDAGEFINVRPIRKGKEEIVEHDQERALE